MQIRFWRYWIGLALLGACVPAAPTPGATNDNTVRIVSLDYCADQFVLKLADRNRIAALSPDSQASFSYMRDQALGLPQVRPRAEDVLLLNPDIVVRSYGGGPNAAAFFERAGINIVQIGFADDVQSIEQIIADAADGLGAPERGDAAIAEMKQRLAALPYESAPASILYMTSKGAAAGRNTLIDELFNIAGYRNFQNSSGWGSIPLERLAYESPDIIATGFFETSDLTTDIWSPSRHPVARRRLQQTPTINLSGAWTSCSGWFLLDAIEALAAGPLKDAP